MHISDTIFLNAVYMFTKGTISYNAVFVTVSESWIVGQQNTRTDVVWYSCLNVFRISVVFHIATHTSFARFNFIVVILNYQQRALKVFTSLKSKPVIRLCFWMVSEFCVFSAQIRDKRVFKFIVITVFTKVQRIRNACWKTLPFPRVKFINLDLAYTVI